MIQFVDGGIEIEPDRSGIVMRFADGKLIGTCVLVPASLCLRILSTHFGPNGFDPEGTLPEATHQAWIFIGNACQSGRRSRRPAQESPADCR